MKRGGFQALERVALAAHVARNESVVVGTGQLLELLAAVQEAEEVRRLCGEASTYVGVEPQGEAGARNVARVKARLREVWKGLT